MLYDIFKILMEEFDINKTIAEFMSSKLDDLMSSGSNLILDAKEKLKINLKIVYSSYLERVYDRYGKSKSFFIRDEPIAINEFYVPVGLESPKVKMNTANLKAILNINNFSVITGTGGAGKTILLKYLFLDSLKNKTHVPIFIELRDLNSNNYSLSELIKITTEDFGLDVNFKHFELCKKKGHFIIFLDGLDEISRPKKDEILKEINNLTITYPKLKIILTTRPDIKLMELDIFTTFKTIPLSLPKCIQLITKLPADDVLKGKFIKDLNGGLYEKHQSFLSNPLLLSIMMLTYGFSADIPNKSSIFYTQAFDALFQRHDSFKGAYKRKRETNLDIQEFSKVFSTFCILTYEDRIFKFSRPDVIDFLEKAKKITSIEFDSEAYINDLLQSVSLLIEDGMSLYFTHRSFQEFFTAKFIVESNEEHKSILFEKYSKYAHSDSVFELAREIDKDFVDFEIIQPFIKNLFELISLKKNVNITNYLKYIKVIWKRFEFKNGSLYGVSNDQKYNQMLYFILNECCTEEFHNNISNSGSGIFISKQKKITENNETVISFDTEKMTTKDQITKELYNNGIYFSKSPLKGLSEVYESIEQRKKGVTESLTDLLLK